MAITYVGAGTEGVGASAANPSGQTYPSGIAAGDLLVVFATTSVATVYATTAMSAAGFTRRYGLQSGGTSPSGACFYKIATGSESGSYTVTSPGGIPAVRMFAYRGVDQTNPFDVADATFGSSTAVTAYDVPSQTTTMTGCTLVTHAWSNATTGTFSPPTVPSAFTEVWDSNASGTAGVQEVAHLIAWGSSGATGIRNVVRSAAVRGGAAGIALRPAADPVAPRNVRAYNPALNRSYNW